MNPRRHWTAMAITVMLMSCPLTLAPQNQQAEAAEAATMAELIAEFRAGATLAQWQAQHPEDTVEPYELNEEAAYTGANVDWCARGSLSVSLPGGRRVQRYAYFFVPQPAAGEALPQGVDEPELTQQCTLGHLWVETQETDPAAGVALARELANALEGRLGNAERGVKTMFFGAAAWEEQARWNKSPATIVSAYDKSLTGQGRRRVLAFATTPVAQNFNESPEEDELQRARRTVREVVRATGIEPQATELVRFLDQPPDPCSGQELASALSRWMQAAAGWAGERKAGALIVADLALANADQCFQQVKPRERLAQVGAGFEYSELGAGWVYTRNWLRQAARLPAGGSIGDIAFAEWMSTGLQQHCCCREPEQGFRRVINRGEEFLRQKHAPAIEARVHFLTGDAYRDIVALAGGAGDIYADAKDFRAEAPSARRKAIAHYRTGLKIESGTPEARAAWRSAWRLIANLNPGDTRFLCIYD